MIEREFDSLSLVKVFSWRRNQLFCREIPGCLGCTPDKNPPLPKGDKGGMSARNFPGSGMGRVAAGCAALATSVGSKSGAGHRNTWPAESRVSVRVPVPGRGKESDDKKSPFVKGGQRGNVNMGFFRIDSGALYTTFAISAGSKSGAGHRKNPSVRGCCSPGSGGRAL